MRYYVTLDAPKTGGEPASDSSSTSNRPAAPVEVDVTELPSGELQVRVSGELVDVDHVSIPSSGALSVRVEGHLVDLTTEGSPPDVGVIASGHRSYVRVVSERQRAADAATKGAGRAGEKVVKSPMPGRVVKVFVKKGDEVAAGQPLLIIEAMKMENELRAKAPGTVAEVHADTGAAVEANAKLVTFA
ncbi:biotin/lipoyl-containing protein [Pendulispora albinea]|uniref:biotin/lipoyl-containing protein n=1 Tax=Pendulispora albinea TaxID=2741071 RepID=UPI00374E03CC